MLPDDPYEPWTDEARTASRGQYLDLLRLLGRWHDVLAEEPADEQAHLALARNRAEADDIRGALLQLERLEQALQRELGATPSAQAVQLRRDLERRQALPRSLPSSAPATDGGAAVRLFGRKDVGDRLRAVLEQAGAGRGVTLLVAGSAGIGQVGRPRPGGGPGPATGVEGGPRWRLLGRGSVALRTRCSKRSSALCRRHPALLDGLGDDYRAEIERALTGRDLGWTGENSHQRLFVAAAELMRVAAAGPGLLLVVDDLHDADEASLRLLHYLSRCAVDERVVLVLAHREPAPALVHDVTAEHGGAGRRARGRAGAAGRPRHRSVCCSTGSPSSTGRPWRRSSQTGGGLPFADDRDGTSAGERLRPRCRPSCRRTRCARSSGSRSSACRSAPTSSSAVAECSEDETYDQLELAVAALVVEPAEGGFRFRHPLVREGLVQQLAAARDGPGSTNASRRRWPRWTGLRAGSPTTTWPRGSRPGQCPTSVQAVEIAGALGAYRDALTLVDGVREHAGPEHRPVLLARRGDLLMALGDPGAVAAYAEAVRVTTGTRHRLVRARLARAAAVAGDLATARSALTGLELRGRRGGCLRCCWPAAWWPTSPATWRPRGGSRRRLGTDFVGSTTRGTSLTWSGCRVCWRTTEGSGSRASAPSCDGRRDTTVWPAPCSTPTSASRRTCSTAASPIRRSSPRPSSCGSAPVRPARCEGWRSPPR